MQQTAAATHRTAGTIETLRMYSVETHFMDPIPCFVKYRFTLEVQARPCRYYAPASELESSLNYLTESGGGAADVNSIPVISSSDSMRARAER